MRAPSQVLALLVAGVCGLPLAAGAQVELVDPDAKDIVKKSAPAPAPARRGTGAAWDQPTGDPSEDVVDEDEPPKAKPKEPVREPPKEPVREPPKEPAQPRAEPRAVPAVDLPRPARLTEPRGVPAGSVDAGTADAGVPGARPDVLTIVVATRSDAELEDYWVLWKAANAGTDIKAEQAARADLVRVRRESGAGDMESWAVGLLRASAAHEDRGDSGGAIEIALGAVELAPQLPAAWSGLAEAYLRADPSELGRVLGAVKQAVRWQLSDPRYSRPLLADLASLVILALIGTTILVIGVLFLRRAYYFLFDWHFFFPRAAARWQTSALALIVLTLPIVFRMGIAPSLLALFAAVVFYLGKAERVVGTVLIALLGAVPVLSGWLVERTAFAGTAAERLAVVDNAGPGSEAAASELAKLATDQRASFNELFVLGRWELLRGRLDPATTHLKAALNMQPNQPGAQVNLGVAMFLTGDLENPRGLFEEAIKADPDLAVARYNLGRLYQRRVATRGESAAPEVDRASQALSEARALDPTLVAADLTGQASVMANELMRTVRLPRSALLAGVDASDAAARVRSQLSLIVLGDVNESVATFYPLAIALALLGLASLARSLDTARACAKCGRAVSKRADPEVSAGSPMCTQCVNVFAKKNVVAPSLKVRKQLEVARYESRLQKTSYVLGAVVSGLGHVFGGWPVRGTIYAFIFVLAVVAFVMRNGVLRAPYEPLPVAVRLVPLGVLFALTYLLSLRGLRKRQG